MVNAGITYLDVAPSTAVTALPRRRGPTQFIKAAYH
jgi:hypothetical protein